MSDTKIEVLDYYPQCIIYYELKSNLKKDSLFSRKYSTTGTWRVIGNRNLKVDFRWPHRPSEDELMVAVQTVKNMVDKIK